LLLHLLGNLRLDFFKGWKLRRTDVVHTDNVVAKLRLDWRVGRLTLVQLEQGFGEFRHIAGRIGPVQVAALGAGAGVLGLLLGDVFKLAAFFQAGDDGDGFAFLFDQNVACFEFLAAVGCGELVVFSLQVSVSNRVFLLVAGKQFADHQRLARQFHLRPEVVSARNSLFFGFLHENFACDDLFAQLAFHFRRDRSARLCDLLGQRIEPGLGNRLPIDDGKVLRCRTRAQGQQAGHGGSHQKLFLHDQVKSLEIVRVEWRVPGKSDGIFEKDQAGWFGRMILTGL